MADSDDPNLNVRVTAESDVSGIREAEEGVSGLKGTLGETATELRHLTGSSREGQEIFRGLGAAASGGAKGVGEMVRGLRSLALVATHIMTEGPLGILIIGIGTLAGYLLATSKNADSAADGVEKIGKKAEETAKRIDAIKKAVDESLKPLTQELKNINEQYGILKTRMSEAESSAKELESSQLKLAEATNRLEEEHAIEGANGDETKINYIRKKFEAQRDEIKAQQDLNTSGQSLLEAQKLLGAATEHAAKVSAEASKESQILADAKEDEAKKTLAAHNAIQLYNDALQRANDARAAIKNEEFLKHPLGVEGGPAIPAQLVALHAKLSVLDQEATNAGVAKDQVVKDATDAAVKARDIEQKGQPIQDAAAKAAAEVESAQILVDNRTQVAKNETATAEANVATAAIKARAVDGVTVDTSEPPLEKEESREQKAADRAASAEVRQDKKQAAAEAKSAAKEEKAEAKQEKTEERAEEKQHKEKRESEGKEDKAAALEKAQHDKAILEELKKHTAALHYITANTGPKKEEKGPSHVAVNASIRSSLAERRMANMFSDTSP